MTTICKWLRPPAHLGFGYGTASANNGNMMQQTIWAPDNGSGSPWTVTQDYTYDAVNRLATATEKLGGVTQWSRTYGYEHFGNRWVSGATGHTLHSATPTSSGAISASTNRLTGTGIAYDNAGNLTAHPYITPGSGSMAYDANNKMTSFTATGVSVATKYDAAGRRVRKIHNGKATIWVYDAFGNLAAEYTMETQTDEATYFRTTDHLGSTRLTTDEMGDVVARRDYFPFGERIDSTLSGRGSVLDGTTVSFNSSPGMRQQFTGQQRDEETGLDYFWERCFCAALARFFSADPGNAGSAASTPQSWNAYSYVYNNPLFWVDPDGRDPTPPAIIDMTKAVKFVVVVLDVPPPNPWDAYAQADIISGNYTQELQTQNAQYHTSLGRSLTSMIAGPTPKQILDQAVKGAIKRVNDPNSECGSLFGSIDTTTALSNITIRLLPTPNQPTLVAGVHHGADWIAVNPSGGFFSGIATDSVTGQPVDLLQTTAFSGLSSLQEVQEAILIHEFTHALGLAGPDNSGQQITLPNGSVVTGTTGISQEVVRLCF